MSQMKLSEYLDKTATGVDKICGEIFKSETLVMAMQSGLQIRVNDELVDNPDYMVSDGDMIDFQGTKLLVQIEKKIDHNVMLFEVEIRQAYSPVTVIFYMKAYYTFEQKQDDLIVVDGQPNWILGTIVKVQHIDVSDGTDGFDFFEELHDMLRKDPDQKVYQKWENRNRVI